MIQRRNVSLNAQRAEALVQDGTEGACWPQLPDSIIDSPRHLNVVVNNAGVVITGRWKTH